MRNIYSGKLFYFYLTPRSLLDPPPPYAVQIISPSQLLPPASFLDYTILGTIQPPTKTVPADYRPIKRTSGQVTMDTPH